MARNGGSCGSISTVLHPCSLHAPLDMLAALALSAFVACRMLEGVCVCMCVQDDGGWDVESVEGFDDLGLDKELQVHMHVFKRR